MDSFVIFWLGVFILSILIIGGLIYFAYWLPKKFGKRKLGVWLSSIISILVLLLLLSFVFEDALFIKSDALKKLKDQNITLNDAFRINSNKKSGISDFSHRFDLTISNRDKERIIKQILNSENYQDSLPDMFDIRENKPRHSDSDSIYTANYQNENYYTYESYKLNKSGTSPTWIIISISKKENKLIYQLILE